MRISSISNNYYINNNFNNKKNASLQKGLIIGNNTTLPESYGRNLVNFKSSAEIIKKLEKIPFQEKFWQLSGNLDVGNALLVTNNLKSFQRMFNDIVQKKAITFNKISVMIEPKIEENIFLLALPDKTTLYNINERPMIINGMDSILPDSARLVEPDDRIRMLGSWTPIYSDPVMDLTSYVEYYSKTYDFTERIDKTLLSLTKSFVDEIVNPPRKNEKDKITFESVGGQDEAIKKLKENALFPMRFPKAFKGMKPCRGAILYGPPGTGKSLLAKAFANESGATVFEQSATEFASKYHGASEKICRELFDKAIEAQPSIIFIDEIDALGKARGGTDDFNDNTLNQFLKCMTQIDENNDKVFVIGATNRVGVLDPALTRAKRLELLVECKAPDLKGTKDILNIYTKDMPLEDGFNKENIAEKMFKKSLTGADIASISTKAHLNALIRTGIYKSMWENKFSDEKMDYFRISEVDFEKAIEDFQSSKSERKSIGFIRGY